MDMQLNHAEYQFERPCGSCRSSFGVAGDVTLPGSLRETTSILHASAMAVTERCEALQDRISASGRVIFCVLYTQGDSGRIDSMEATADFTHLCDLPGAIPRAEVFAQTQAETVEASVQNGRVALKTDVLLCARAAICEPLDVITGIEAEGVQLKTCRHTLRRTVARGSADELLREEFDLPAALAVQDTLCARATAVFHDAAGGQGRIGLAGEVTIEAVHASAIPGKPLVVTRHTVPVSQSVEITGDSGDLLDGRITVKDVAVASQDMGDGERTLRAEVLLGLSAWADREESTEVLTDAYTTTGDGLRLSQTGMQLRTGDNRMHAAESGKASLLLPEGSQTIRTILAAFAVPIMSSAVQQGSRLVTEGVLHTTLVYMSDGAVPVSVQLETPFRTAFAANAAPEDVVTLTAANVEAVPVTSDRAELRYILQADVDGVETVPVTLVTEAAVVPAEQVTKDVVLYFVQPGEDAWTIARRYRVTEKELRSLNPELDGDPQVGQGVVVWRRSVL